MADRIITVTDPSVVTNDTLASYNNYTDQPSADTLIGSMTPTEATNGKTVTLADGLVHEVTTKPVGTTNGEFSAVVSNAVQVDLSGGTFTAINTTVGATTPPIESPTNVWTADAASGLFGSLGYDTAGFTGDFQFRIFTDTLENNFGIGLDASSGEVAGFTDSDYFAFRTTSSVSLKTNGSNVTEDATVNMSAGATKYLRWERVGTQLQLIYYNGTADEVVHTFSGVSGTLYPTFYCADGSVVYRPERLG